MTSATAMFSDNVVISDLIAWVLTLGITVSLLKLLERTATRGVFEQCRKYCFSCDRNIGSVFSSCATWKLLHISFGLVFLLCWPMFSSGHIGAIVASLIPAMNVINMLLLGLGIWKDDATVKSMTRNGDIRELLKGPLYYASAITLFTVIYWRTFPIAIAAICNVCAGDGVADIIGRRFGREKLPYNRNKSFAGSIAMACAGFVASIGYMMYFRWFGYMEGSSVMVVRFLVVSIACALVESHPISTLLDDNLTVPLVVILLGTLLF
ncbi:hypothetical protein OROMI_012630 [Orobanche minor]